MVAMKEMLFDVATFERYESLPSEVKFKVRTIRRWGFNFARGTVDGEEHYFLARSDRAVGEEFEEGGVLYKISEILEELPPKKRIRFRVDVIDGRAHVVGFLDDGTGEIFFTIPAAALLEQYLTGNGYVQIRDNIRSISRTVEIEKKHGEIGRTYPYDAWPSELKEAYRRLKDVIKDAGFGRVAVSYFGKSEDGKLRYRVSVLVPTLALLDEEIAQELNKALSRFPDY